MTELSKIYLYRMTHIENMPHILAHGITHINSANKNKDYKAIGDNSLINTRNTKLLSNRKKLGDYIPFYFGARMPMLYVIQNGFNNLKASKAEDIVYCVSSVAKIQECNLPFIFTDGHAVEHLTTHYMQADIGNVEQIVDFKAVRSKYWIDKNDLDLKRRKEAEFLVEKDIPLKAIIAYLVYNDNAKSRLSGLGINEKNIHVGNQYYF